jgi:hypothetical protein
MKLRIRDNSVRLRLTRGEVDMLRDVRRVAGRTGFPGGREFRYVVESSAACNEAGASFSDTAITVQLPQSSVVAWANSEQVSIVGEQVLGDGEFLAILVEKDFACLAPREGEDDSDAFAHPEADNDNVTC